MKPLRAIRYAAFAFLGGCGCVATTTPTPPEPTFVPPTPTTSPTAFDITYEFLGDSLTESQGQAVLAAFERWESIVRGELPNTSGSVAADSCGVANAAWSGSVDDLHVQVIVDSAPSAHHLGTGSACKFRTDGTTIGQPYFGVLLIYGDALASVDKVTAVATHETGHILGVGIGPVWNSMVSGSSFTGTQATAQWTGAGKSGYPPLVGAHWSEAAIPAEVMSEQWNPGVPNLITPLTVGALDDLGYDVSYAAADGWG